MANETPEQIARFAAEMAALSKRPELRPFLTSTEAKRQAKDKEREDAEKARKEEEWMIESSRRYEAIAAWFDDVMGQLCPAEWMEYGMMAKENPHDALRKLRKAGWKMHARFVSVTKPGHEPVAATNVLVLYRGMIKRMERLVWEDPKPIKSKIILGEK